MAAKYHIITASLAALIAAVVTAATFAIVGVTAHPDDAMTSVDKACVALLHHGGVPEDCTRMYRLEVMP